MPTTMPVAPADLPAWISAISAAVTALITGAALIVAAIGISAWKKEWHWKTNHDLARRILLGVYRVQGAIEKVRQDSLHMDNWIVALDEETSIKALEEWFERMLKVLDEPTNAMKVDLVEARVYWSNELDKPWETMTNLIRDLRLAMRKYRKLHDPRIKKQYERTDIQGKLDEAEAVIFQGVNDPAQDPYLKKVLDAVGEFEKALKPRIRS